MRIGVVNAGNIGRALTRAWLEAGHEVMVAKDGNQEKLDAFVDENPRALRGTLAQAAEFGEVILFSVYWPRLDAVLNAVGPMDGKVVIDTMNPLRVSEDFEHTYDQTFMAQDSTSEELQRRRPGARVVKAFNTMASTLLDKQHWSDTETKPAVFIASDDSAAKAQAASLVQDAGFSAIDAGPLVAARSIEGLNILLHHVAEHHFEGAMDRIAPAIVVARS